MSSTRIPALSVLALSLIVAGGLALADQPRAERIEKVEALRSLANQPTDNDLSPLITLSGGARAVRGEVLVQFRAGVGRAAGVASLQRNGAILLREYTTVGVSLARITSGEGVSAVVDRLRRDPTVLSASPNFIFEPTNHLTRPNDPEFPRQWHLDNRGQNPPDERFADTGAGAAGILARTYDWGALDDDRDVGGTAGPSVVGTARLGLAF